MMTASSDGKSAQAICERCGTALPRAVTEGLCPRCLLETVVAFAPESDTNPPSGGPRLGQLLDADSGLLQNFVATADDVGQFDDEDGVTFLSRILPGCPAQAAVVTSTAAKLDAWIDFNQDGDWDDSDEKIFNSVSVNAGNNILSFTGSTNIVRPGGIVRGLAYARFRLSTAGNLNYFGLATDGEVEDHIAPLGMVLLVQAGAQPQQLEFSWQDDGELYALQHTPQLNPANWQDVSSGTLSNGNWYQTINLTLGSGYYRLRLKP